MGGAQARPAGEMDLRALGELSSPTRTAAITSPRREMAFDGDGKITGLKVHTTANLGAYMSTFSSAVPTFLYATLLSGQYEIPHIYCEVDAVYTNTVPVDAYRGAGRPEATFVVERLVEVGARELGMDPADLRQKNFVRAFPYQTSVASLYDAGDYNASLQKALQIHDYKGFGKRKRESERHGKLRGIGFATYIEACGVAPSSLVGQLGAGVGLMGIGRGAGQSDRLGGTAHRLSSTRPGPRDHVRATGVGAARHSDRQCVGGARRHRQGAVRHGHLRLALRRRRHVGDRQGARQGRGQSQKRSPPICSKPPMPTSSSRTASSPSPAPTSRRPGARSRSAPMWRTNSPPAKSSPG